MGVFDMAVFFFFFRLSFCGMIVVKGIVERVRIDS